MTNFSDPSSVRIDEVGIPVGAHGLLEDLAVIKNTTVDELIEEYILAGLPSDIQHHQSLGMQYASYLREKHQYDSCGRWKF